MIFDDTHQKRQGLPYEYRPYGLYDGAQGVFELQRVFVSSFLELHALKIPEFLLFGLYDVCDRILEYERVPLPSGCQLLQEQLKQSAHFAQLYLYHSEFFQ
jgi:hypothetical protein